MIIDQTAWRHVGTAILLLFAVMMSSCASYRQTDFPLEEDAYAYKAPEKEALLNRYAPVFVVEEPDKAYNRIGTPVARMDGDEEIIEVAPEKATIYTAEQQFTTENGSYINLLYRVHFPYVPFSLMPFYLGAGDNVGLIVVVTLDREERPLLYTLVQTCGCYLAFIPTSHLPQGQWKEGLHKDRQRVYGENLPGFLDYSQQVDEKLAIHIRPATHRVQNIRLATDVELEGYVAVEAELLPFQSLENLDLGDGATTSFYEVSGPRQGYVKGSHKIWERLLISWWALDWRVGEDKKLGLNSDDGIVFYTSLKPWAREASDLRDFPGFLRYWGWRL
ncbi:MAG: hypothetical protein V2I36_11030 [Desulfopila sp.]|jgi:hypothetical protein|nr:hypothetical protein [Desulfopila sp.]